jgi:hypothetical protein
MAVVLKLARLNGLRMLPQALFEPNGDLKSEAQLEAMLEDQLQRLDAGTRTMLQTNVEDAHLETWRQLERRARPRPDDAQWFLKTFGVLPRSARHVRQVLLQQNASNLHWFIRSDGVPWVNLSQLVALLRSEPRL